MEEEEVIALALLQNATVRGHALCFQTYSDAENFAWQVACHSGSAANLGWSRKGFIQEFSKKLLPRTRKRKTAHVCITGISHVLEQLGISVVAEQRFMQIAAQVREKLSSSPPSSSSVGTAAFGPKEKEKLRKDVRRRAKWNFANMKKKLAKLEDRIRMQ